MSQLDARTVYLDVPEGQEPFDWMEWLINHPDADGALAAIHEAGMADRLLLWSARWIRDDLDANGLLVALAELGGKATS